MRQYTNQKFVRGILKVQYYSEIKVGKEWVCAILYEKDEQSMKSTYHTLRKIRTIDIKNYYSIEN